MTNPTQRFFTIEVAGCGNCPYSDARFGCKNLPMDKVDINNPIAVILENFNAITESCPMYPQSQEVFK